MSVKVVGLENNLLKAKERIEVNTANLASEIASREALQVIVEDLDAGKVAKVTTASKIYSTDSTGIQSSLPYAESATVSSIPVRTSTGQLKVPLTPTANDDAISKSYGTATYATAAQGTKADTLEATAELKANKLSAIAGTSTTSYTSEAAVVSYSEAKVNKKLTITDSDTDYPTTRAVKNFVNSSITATAADKVTKDTAGTILYTSLQDVIAGPWYINGTAVVKANLTKNDYAIFSNTAEGQWRAKYDGTAWTLDYKVGSVFTAAQNNAIESGITSAIVSNISSLTSPAQAQINSKQATITATGTLNLLTAPAAAGGQPGIKSINTLLTAPVAQPAGTQLLVAPAVQGGVPTLKPLSELASVATAVTGVSLVSGTNNGTVKLTTTVNGADTTTDNIAVKGLSSAAYKAAGTASGQIPLLGAAASTTLNTPAVFNAAGNLIPHASGALKDAAFTAMSTINTSISTAVSNAVDNLNAVTIDWTV